MEMGFENILTIKWLLLSLDFSKLDFNIIYNVTFIKWSQIKRLVVSFILDLRN